MSIFLCHAVATRAGLAQYSAKTIQSEQDIFEAKGLELSRRSRRRSIAPNMDLKTSPIIRSLIVAPLAFLAVMTFNEALASVTPQDDTMEARNCSATVQDMTEIVIAQSGKARTTMDNELAKLPVLIAQQNKARQGTVQTPSVVNYVRCSQNTN